MTILIAEDDSHTRAALCEVLREEGFTTITSIPAFLALLSNGSARARS